MIRAGTSIVVYGIKITEEIAKHIYEKEFDKNKGIFKSKEFYENIFFRRVSENRNDQLIPVTPYKYHTEGDNSSVFYPHMWANETDLKIESLVYQPKKEHYLGIYVGGNGYPFNDKILSLIKKTPKEAIKNFDIHIRPLMQKYNMSENPDIILINQIL